MKDAFAEFSTGTSRFAGYDVIRDSGAKQPYSWWATHGGNKPSSTIVSHEAPLSSDFILSLREELEHMRICMVSRRADLSSLGNGVCAHQPLPYLQAEP